MARAERAALGVLFGQRLRVPSVSSDANASASACAESMPGSLGSPGERLVAVVELFDELRVDGEALGHVQHSSPRCAQLRHPGTAVSTLGLGERSSRYSPVEALLALLGDRRDLRLQALVQAA